MLLKILSIYLMNFYQIILITIRRSMKEIFYKNIITQFTIFYIYHFNQWCSIKIYLRRKYYRYRCYVLSSTSKGTFVVIFKRVNNIKSSVKRNRNTCSTVNYKRPYFRLQSKRCIYKLLGVYSYCIYFVHSIWRETKTALSSFTTKIDIYSNVLLK